MTEHSYFIGEKVFLRPMEPEDLEYIYAMENDPAHWVVSNFTVPYSRYAIKKYLEDSQCDIYTDKQLRMMIVLEQTKEVVGIVDITDFAPLHSRAEVGIVIEKKHRSAGYATTALKLICEYAFSFLHIKQLSAHIATDNDACVRLFTSCGFERCGLLKKWVRVGSIYKDVVLMQRINNDGE